MEYDTDINIFENLASISMYINDSRNIKLFQTARYFGRTF